MGIEVWVAGFPSYYGGADTELDHLIDLFRHFDVAVNLVPMFGAVPRMKESVLERGCKIHPYSDDVFKDKIVISYCNSNFLKRLPTIAKEGRPARTIWFNCMTWLFEKEREAHAEGLLDYFGFQSEYQKTILLPQLEQIGPVRTFDYRPYFHTPRIEWKYREWEGCYKIGRISRDDANKFAADTWRIFDRVLVPKGLRKKVYILGYGRKAKERCGEPPRGLDWMTWSPNSISSAQFYNTIDTMIHKTGGSRENSPRVLFEACAHGVVSIVERAFGFPELVIHGETGFMADTSDEMSYYASMLAMNQSVHREMAENARAHLETTLSSRDISWNHWQALLAG
jgi:glycosyltransferase involved in cell wall biosynthesis